MTKNPFPKNFFWGASTSSHQVEGGTVNQWSVWELAHAVERAKHVHRSSYSFAPTLPELEVWPDIKEAVTKPQNYVSGKGVEHYTRYKEDLALAAKLNLNSFRFGIEWSRIEPEEGQWNQAAIEHYKEYIKAIRQAGLEPFMNIWHWTNPIWFEDKGGWTSRSNLKYFERFVQKVAEELCEDLTYIITINEANTYASNCYLLGVWPPMHKNFLECSAVYYNLILAHKRAYRILKSSKQTLLVGVAHQASLNRPHNPNNPLERLAAWASNYFWQNWFYNRIRRQQDFMGMNFYFVNYIQGFKIKNPSKPLNDMGWYMEPAGVGEMVKVLYRKYRLPIIVTESGVADMQDRHRRWWLEETITAMETALASGVDLRGYLHWSLLDNFEWAEGWWPKFGLIEVDREHGMKRKVRPSAMWLAKKLKSLG